MRSSSLSANPAGAGNAT